MFADNSSTDTSSAEQEHSARENIHTHEKAAWSELQKRKAMVIKLGKAQKVI